VESNFQDREDPWNCNHKFPTPIMYEHEFELNPDGSGFYGGWDVKVEVCDYFSNIRKEKRELASFTEWLYEEVAEWIDDVVNTIRDWVLEVIKDRIQPIISGIINIKNEGGLYNNNLVKSIKVNPNAYGSILSGVDVSLFLTSNLAIYAFNSIDISLFILLFIGIGIISTEDVLAETEDATKHASKAVLLTEAVISAIEWWLISLFTLGALVAIAKTKTIGTLGLGTSIAIAIFILGILFLLVESILLIHALEVAGWI
jgi:hypothetical protein